MKKAYVTYLQIRRHLYKSVFKREIIDFASFAQLSNTNYQSIRNKAWVVLCVTTSLRVICFLRDVRWAASLEPLLCPGSSDWPSQFSGSKLFEISHVSPTIPSEWETVQESLGSFWTVPWPNALPFYRSHHAVQCFLLPRTSFWPSPSHPRYSCSWYLCHPTLHVALIPDLLLHQSILHRVCDGSLLEIISFPVHLIFLI